jgi:energy-coupling factor transporter ATP-binding protein EcfA2
MDMNKLTITITGTTGSGKTTLAQYIAEILWDDGIKVDVQDTDDDNFVISYRETGNKYEFFERLSKNLASIAEKTEVSIVTTQQVVPAPVNKTKVPEYLWSGATGSAWVPCRIIPALLPPEKKFIWCDPWGDGIGEEIMVDTDRIRYI